jgi:hypothetical protein
MYSNYTSSATLAFDRGRNAVLQKDDKSLRYWIYNFMMKRERIRRPVVIPFHAYVSLLAFHMWNAPRCSMYVWTAHTTRTTTAHQSYNRQIIK